MRNITNINKGNAWIDFSYSDKIDVSNCFEVLKAIYRHLLDNYPEFQESQDLWRRMYVPTHYANVLNLMFIEQGSTMPININTDYHERIIGFNVKEEQFLERFHILLYKHPSKIK